MNILDEAAELINGQRAKDYGEVTENFQRIADLWQTYLDGIHPINKIDCHDVAMMMVLVKVARQSNGYHRDSAVDIAGYAALDEKVHAPRVWESIKDIPEGVVAQDKLRWYWKVSGSQSASSTNGKDWSPFEDFFPREDDYRPFTEVLDIEPEGSK